MRTRSNRMACVVAALLLATPVLAQEYFYTPAPAAGDAAPATADGVLVREITVKKGDTLYQLSKQFSGKGSYYPQILLFNELKNPDLIHPGNVLRVPVSAKNPAVAATVADTAQAAADAGGKQRPRKSDAAARSHDTKKAAARPPKKTEAAPKAQATPAAERSQYARAQEAVKKGDCPSAIKLLDGFLATHPNSPLAPEATLSRAECYMKLSSP